MDSKTFSIDTPSLDYAKKAEKIANTLCNAVLKQFRKRGVVCCGGNDCRVN